MKITDVEAIVLDTGKDYPDPYEENQASGVRFILLVKITTDEGIVGWSDVETQPHVGKMVIEAPPGGPIGFASLKAALIGEDPLERERLWQKMYRYIAYYGRQGVGMQMISGIDIALWDIAGKAFKQPIYKILGAKYRDRVRAYASTLFRPTADGMKRAVSKYIQQGFKAIKFGWGAFGFDTDLDIALLRAAREEAGPEIDIMVDPGWYSTSRENPYRPRSKKEWIKLIEEFEQIDVFWLEDFIHPENIEGYADIARHIRSLRLATGEQFSGIRDFERLVRVGRIDVLQPDLSRCGGLTVGKQIADFATREEIECAPHAWLTHLLTAASLHLNAYLMNALYLEYNVSENILQSRLCKNGIEFIDGYVLVPEGNGLGIEVDEQVINELRVSS